MRAILRDIPLGSKRTEIGLVLRQAWFLIGCFLNSEVWSGYSDRDLKDLKVIGHNILRLITGAQAKVPSEMLYLETAQLPIINVTRDSQNCHKAIPLTSSPYERSSKVIRGPQSSSKAINMYHKN